MSGAVSELERFLQEVESSQEAEPTSILGPEVEKSLKELGERTFPEPLSWTLKVVQAAVLSGAENLQVSHCDTEIRFEFTPETWAEPESQDLVFQSIPADNVAFGSLRAAIWDIGLGQGYPFQLTLPGSQNTLLWKGEELERRGTEVEEKVRFTVSHRNLERGEGRPFLRPVQPVGRSAEIALFLKRRAHTAPLQLTVNEERFDGIYQGLMARNEGSLSLSQKRASKDRAHPLLAFAVRTAGPVLSFPLGNTQTPSFAGYTNCEPLSKDFELPKEGKRDGGLAVLSANIGASGEKRELVPLRSQLNWVKAGVVVQSETIPVDPFALYLTLYVCADHIPTDSSGLSLKQEDLSGLRLRALLACSEHLAANKPDLELSNSTLRGGLKTLGYGFLVGGAAMATIAFSAGIATFFAGAGLAYAGHTGLNGLSSGLNNHHAQFCKNWAQKFPVQ